MYSIIKLFKENISPIFGLNTTDLDTDLSKRLYFFTALTIIILISAFGLFYLIQGSYSVAALQFMIVFVTILSCFIYLKTGSTNLAGSFLLIFASTSGFLRTLWLGGINSPAIYIWPIVPLFATATMSFRYALSWTFVYIGIALYFNLADRNGIVFATELKPHTLSNIRMISIISVQILIVIVINYIRSVNRKYRALIEKRTEEKTNLLRVLSHDVATPMTILKTSLRRLERYSSEPNIDLQRMKHSINVITNIFEHVKELEAISSGKKEMTLQKVNLIEIFNELKELHQNAIESKEIQLSLEFLKHGGDFIVLADRRGLCYQVFNNILSNAIKFTDTKGHIHITVESLPNFTRSSIKDSGVGIPEELISRIFNTSSSTSRQGTHGEKGTGFGMPIVKSYIDKFNGKIEIQSIQQQNDNAQHGTTITITLPNAL